MARVRLTDVASAAGVSSATASLVLNDREARISEQTRTRVVDAATKLGYSPNSLARGLRTQRTHTIGLVSDTIATTPFAGNMLAGVDEVAREYGHLVFIVNTEGDTATECSAIDALRSHQVDRIVYATMWHRVVTAPPGLPANSVLLDCRDSGNSFPAVIPDEVGGGEAAGWELIAAGHRRIAYIDILGEGRPIAAELRYQGLCAVMREAGIEPDPELRVYTSVSGRRDPTAAGALLDLPEDRRPTAFFAFNDRAALSVYAAANLRGLRIPEDLSVVGFDDQPVLVDVFDPPLTTVALPHHEMGRWAMEVAVGARSHDTTEGPFLMRCPVVVRESVGPPPRPDDRARRRT